MSGRSPKRGRKKKSNKGRKPKKPLSKEEIAAKKNQKNMRETCRRVEINLHYELLYHSLGENLVYNRAERVQLLRKAIIKMAELKAQVTALTDQVRAAGITPRTAPNFQLNESQKLFMLVQRWARNDAGKKCSRAKLKPVGIEITDDNQLVPITVPYDGRRYPDHLGDDNDHIPFWAAWETNTYIVVDQEAFEKACNQAIIAGWDGRLGSKGAYYRCGLPDTCGLTIANCINSNSSVKYKRRRSMEDDTEDEEDEEEEDSMNMDNKYHQIHIDRSHNNNNHHMVPVFPPRIDFPEIVVHNLEAHALMDGMGTTSENDNSISTAEPPVKKQKLNNGKSKHKRKVMYNQFNIANNSQFIQHSLPLSVPFPAVGAMIPTPIHPMARLNSLNGSPFMNLRMGNNSTPGTPDQVQSTSSDTNSQHSHSKYVKSEPINADNNTPQRVQLPQFLAATTFPPHPHPHPPSHQYQLNSHNLVPVTTFPMYPHPIMHERKRGDSTPNMNMSINTDRDSKHHIIMKQSPKNHDSHIVSAPAARNGICSTISTVSDNENTENNDNKTPPPNINNKISELSPSDSRASHETRNSVVFTPANSKNSSNISTDSNTPEQTHPDKSQRPHKPPIHLPDNTSIDNYVSQLNWNNSNNSTQSEDYNNYDVISSHHIGMMTEIQVHGFQDAANATNPEDGNGMKGSVFYG